MLTLAAWLHTLDPYLWRISGSFGIRWYGASYVMGFVLGYLALLRLARRGHIRIPAERVGDAMMWLIGGTLVGGRLGYVLFYKPSLLTMWLDHAPWWGVLAINEGGMASHGGMVGLMLACWRVSRGWKPLDGVAGSGREGRSSVLHVMDAVALVAPFGVLLGRIANFINGELLGKIVSRPGTPGPWWSVQYPQELTLPPSQVPALQDPESAARLMGLVKRVAPDRPVEDVLAYIAARPSAYASELATVLSSRHPSQLYQAAAEGVVLPAVLWLVWWKTAGARAAGRVHDGLMAGLFFAVYGALRIVTEFYRLPDAHLTVGRPWGLSRGQWYSVPLVLGGVALIVWATRKRARGGAV